MDIRESVRGRVEKRTRNEWVFDMYSGYLVRRRKITI